MLVDFYAEWCGPCKMMAPLVERMAEKYAGQIKIGKLNVDEQGELARKYGVMSIPTLIFFKEGQIEKKAVGFHSLEEIRMAQPSLTQKTGA